MQILGGQMPMEPGNQPKWHTAPRLPWLRSALTSYSEAQNSENRPDKPKKANFLGCFLKLLIF